jgi:hypothetical protein
VRLTKGGNGTGLLGLPAQGVSAAQAIRVVTIRVTHDHAGCLTQGEDAGDPIPISYCLKGGED